jgi:hypothetical protein
MSRKPWEAVAGEQEVDDEAKAEVEEDQHTMSGRQSGATAAAASATSTAGSVHRVVVGAGVAGTCCAEELCRLRPLDHVTLITAADVVKVSRERTPAHPPRR